MDTGISMTEASGQLILTTLEINAEVIKTALTSQGQTDPYEYQDGMSIQYIYTFDAQTKKQTGTTATLIFPDGTTCLLAEDVFLYDTGAEEQEDWLLALKEPEETRTITIVRNPDTDEETTVELTVAKEAEVFIMPDENGDYPTLYQDRACTIAWVTTEEKTDVIMYTK